MEEATLHAFEASLARCSADPRFLDAFYERFLGSSPKVRERFSGTDFVRQKRALRASFDLMLAAARETSGRPPLGLMELAMRHGARQLAIGAELYDLWLDNLLATVEGCDGVCTPDVARAWEEVMGVGIGFLCAHYNA